MAAKIYLSGHLKNYTGGETSVSLDGEPADVREALGLLWKRHPALHDRILNEQGEIRQHVNIFVGNSDVRRQKGLDTAVGRGDLHIFNAVSGG